MRWTARSAAAVLVGAGVLALAAAGTPPPVPRPAEPAPPMPAVPPMPGDAPAPRDIPMPDVPPVPVAPPARATLAEVAFLAGRWRGQTEGSAVEEHWSAPEGRCMMGMFRWVAPGGAPYMFQLMTLTEEGGGVVMRLREFSPELVAREEKDAPKVLHLVEISGEKASFAPAAGAGGADGVERVIYERTAPGTLVFALTFKEEMKREPFRLELTREGAEGAPAP